MSNKKTNYLLNLSVIRREKGLTQRSLAKKSGVSYNTIIKIERGGIPNPTIETVYKLAKGLSITIDELLAGQQ
jgi:transcriptional regulator with XRE-family HTH domain